MSCICGTCPPPCCGTPFIQSNIRKGYQHCLACQKNYKKIMTVECPSCHKESQSLTCLNLRDENGNTDWCACDFCNYKYRRSDLIRHHRIKYLDSTPE